MSRPMTATEVREHERDQVIDRLVRAGVEPRIYATYTPVLAGVDYGALEARVLAYITTKEATLTDKLKKAEPLSIELLRTRLTQVESSLRDYQGYVDSNTRTLADYTESRDKYAAQKKDLEAAIKKLGGKITTTKTVMVEV